MTRRSRWLLFALLAGFLIVSGWCLISVGTFVYKNRTHGAWVKRVRDDLLSVRGKRPPEFTANQWNHLVDWTLNLLANCGSVYRWVDPDWRDEFVLELERRIARPLTLADFDWIWDEFARHTQGGQSYSDNYRPTRGEDWEAMSGTRK